MVLVSDTNQGPLVNLAMWITLAPTAVAVMVKLFTKVAVIKGCQWDDVLILFALLFAVGQSVATSEQVKNGLGQHENTLGSAAFDNFLLSQYVAQILYLMSIYTSKLVGLTFFLTLAGPHSRKAFLKGLYAFTAFWALASIFVISFQCQTPYPWLRDSGDCIDRLAFWTVNTIVDVLTQTGVGLFPALLLRNLQATRRRKIASMIAFTPNLLCIPVSFVRLAYLYSVPATGDYTWNAFAIELATSLHAILSVLTAAVPFSKQFIDSLISMPGVIGDETQLYVTHTANGSSKNKSKGSSNLSFKMGIFGQSLSPQTQLGTVGNLTEISSVPEDHEMQRYETRDGSQEQMVIHHTRSLMVTSSPS